MRLTGGVYVNRSGQRLTSNFNYKLGRVVSVAPDFHVFVQEIKKVIGDSSNSRNLNYNISLQSSSIEKYIKWD